MSGLHQYHRGLPVRPSPPRTRAHGETPNVLAATSQPLNYDAGTMSLDEFFARAVREGHLDIVDWSPNRELGDRRGATNVFPAPEHGDRLPYLAQSMDYVLCVPSSAHQVAEAARVARFGVFEILLDARGPCVKPVAPPEPLWFDVLLLAAQAAGAVHTAAVIHQDALGRARLFSAADVGHLRFPYNGARTIVLALADDVLLERGALALLSELCSAQRAYVLVHKYGAPRLFAAAEASTALFDVDFRQSPVQALRGLCAACESRGFVRNAMLSNKLAGLVEI